MALCRSSSPLTEKGEQGASTTWRMEPADASWYASMTRAESRMISSTVWTTLSGGRPPSLRLRSMLPREADHADAQLLRGGELGADQVPAAGREDIVVVKAGGAAVLHQLSHAGEGAQAHRLLVQSLPDLVEGGEPVEELQVLHLGQIPGEDLIEVVVGVDQAGIAPAAGSRR